MSKKYQSETKVPQLNLQKIGRDRIISEIISKFVDDLPLEEKKRLFNLEEINEVSCVENINNATSKEESEYWEHMLHNVVLRQEVEVFRLKIEL